MVLCVVPKIKSAREHLAKEAGMRITEITPTIQTKEEKLRLAAYCRVSSDSDDQLHSFAAQIRYYTDYTKRNPKYELVDVYADEGITGTEMGKRDELNRLLRDCKRGKIDRIITKSVSRFARNTEELLVTLRLLKELGVSVFFEEQAIDTNQLNAEMIVTFPGMVAQKESETISGNLRWSIQKRMEQGDYVTPRPPFGYRLIDKKLVVYEPEAIIVKQIFELYLNGKGAQQIANILNCEEVRKRSRNGKNDWERGSVLYILSNEKYIGDSLMQKNYTTECLPYRIKRNQGEKQKYYVENYCPSIIEDETFYLVQALKKQKGEHKNISKNHLFSKIIRCPVCGKAFRQQTINGKHYWCCSTFATSANCQSRRLREEMIKECFLVMIYKLKKYQKIVIEDLIKRLEYLRDRTCENIERIKSIDKEIADLSAQNLVVTKLHTNGVIKVAEYSKQTSLIGNKINALRIERRKKLNESEGDVQLSKLKSLNEIILECQPNGEFDEELFTEVVERIIVNDNTKITFCLIGELMLTEEIKSKGRCKVI